MADSSDQCCTVDPGSPGPFSFDGSEPTPSEQHMKKTDLLHATVDHYDIKTVNVVPMIDMMEKTAFQARNLARAAKIVDEMVADHDCGIILTLAGSLIS